LVDGPPAREHHVYLGPKGAVTASPGVKVYGFCRESTAQPTRDAGTGSDPARRTLVASFKGSSYVAEREGEELNVYIITAGAIASATTGDPPASTPTGDAQNRMTPARFQAKIVEARKARGW
jgi:hypothetical protein